MSISHPSAAAPRAGVCPDPYELLGVRVGAFLLRLVRYLARE
jgi:hypothetical protein